MSRIVLIITCCFCVLFMAVRASRCNWGARLEGSIVWPVYLRPWDYVQNVTLDECKANCEVDEECEMISYGFESLGHGAGCKLFDCGPGRCDLNDASDVQSFECLVDVPTKLIVHACLLSGILSASAFAIQYFWTAHSFHRALVGAMSAAILVLILGLLPMLLSKNPERCADFVVNERLGQAALFPLRLVIAGSTVTGMVVTCLNISSWRLLDAHAKLALVYFTASVVCNLVGLLGGLLLSCHAGFLGDQSLMNGLWLTGSIGTNLVLQKMLLLRVNTACDSHETKLLRRSYLAEVSSVAIAMLLIGVGAICYGLNVRQKLVWILVTTIQALCIMSLFFGDLVFSIQSVRILSGVLQKSQTQMVSRAAHDLSLAKARLRARLQLFTVLSAVFTTSVFYVLAILGIVLYLAGGSKLVIDAAFYRAFWISWSLDSLSNDMCGLLVAFPGMSAAVQVIASAGAAHVIGNPLPNTLPTQETAVIGRIQQAGRISEPGSSTSSTNMVQNKAAL